MLTIFIAGNKAVGIMKAGQTFTIEPMINAGKFMYYKSHISSKMFPNT
jgi:methionine aminopeptidase